MLVGLAYLKDLIVILMLFQTTFCFLNSSRHVNVVHCFTFHCFIHYNISHFYNPHYVASYCRRVYWSLVMFSSVEELQRRSSRSWKSVQNHLLEIWIQSDARLASIRVARYHSIPANWHIEAYNWYCNYKNAPKQSFWYYLCWYTVLAF